jgi:hypothetical protein
MVESSAGKIKLKFPAKERSALQPAIDTLGNRKAEALALLADWVAKGSVPTKTAPAGSESLESVLKNQAIELWSDALGERFWLVADEADARLAMERYGARRGQTYSALEAQRIVAVKDPAAVKEIHAWKRRFDGVVRDASITRAERFTKSEPVAKLGGFRQRPTPPGIANERCG